MEFNLLNCKRGQIAIEFMLLLIIMLAFIYTVSMPTVEQAINYAQDVSRLAELKLSAQKIKDAIDYVALSQGDAKRTITIFVPESGEIKFSCTAAGIQQQSCTANFEITLSSEAAECPNKKCTKEFLRDVEFKINSSSLTGPKYYTLVITKTNGAINVQVQ